MYWMFHQVFEVFHFLIRKKEMQQMKLNAQLEKAFRMNDKREENDQKNK
jgi:hypothetical protein